MLELCIFLYVVLVILAAWVAHVDRFTAPKPVGFIAPSIALATLMIGSALGQLWIGLAGLGLGYKLLIDEAFRYEA